ncbi:MAG TPA: MFS transporter [Bacteroidia bacterium]|nr:MFS transporter [Bacteroidia bacterium]
MTINRPLLTLISVFFFWGFVAASNTILIGLFKSNFELTQTQSQFVDSAFYAAYFLGSLVYFGISFFAGDPLNKIGYKKGLVLGLVVSAVGSLGFILAEMCNSFPLMLLSLFTIAMGFTIQQIVANPYVIALGDPSTGAHRVSLAGGINSFGTTIGPLLLALAVYGSISGSSVNFNENGVKKEAPMTIERTAPHSKLTSSPIIYDRLVEGEPGDKYFLFLDRPVAYYSAFYGALPDSINGGIILAYQNDSLRTAAVAELKKQFPDKRVPILSMEGSDAKMLPGEAKLEVKYYGIDAVVLPSLILGGAFLLFAFIMGMSNLPAVSNSEKLAGDLGALKYPQIWLGMIAIFIYVGTEVTIQSNLPEYMRQLFGRAPGTTVHYISLYWGSLMIGRWVGALTVFNLKGATKTLMTIIVPLLAYGVILGVNYIKGSPMIELLKYLPFIGIVILGFFMAAEKPARTMVLFGLMAAVMILIGIVLKNEWSTYCFVSGGLFCSVMWPCIFSLSIAGLGKYTTQGSSLLIMMILGGAILPPLQGYLSDHGLGIHWSYIVPVAGFLYLAYFGWAVKKVLLKQGIDYDKQETSSH